MYGMIRRGLHLRVAIRVLYGFCDTGAFINEVVKFFRRTREAPASVFSGLMLLEQDMLRHPRSLLRDLSESALANGKVFSTIAIAVYLKSATSLRRAESIHS